MAYTPTTWECGDVVTAEALNKIENGIANAGGSDSVIFQMKITEHVHEGSCDRYYYDKTADEFNDAWGNDKLVFMQLPSQLGNNFSWFFVGYAESSEEPSIIDVKSSESDAGEPISLYTDELTGMLYIQSCIS